MTTSNKLAGVTIRGLEERDLPEADRSCGRRSAPSSAFPTRWTSWATATSCGPAPSVWNRGVARSLLDATMAIFDEWGVRHRGLYTFGHSPKHYTYGSKTFLWSLP